MEIKTYVHKIVPDHLPNFHKDPFKDARARSVNSSTRDEMRLTKIIFFFFWEFPNYSYEYFHYFKVMLGLKKVFDEMIKDRFLCMALQTYVQRKNRYARCHLRPCRACFIHPVGKIKKFHALPDAQDCIPNLCRGRISECDIMNKHPLTYWSVRISAVIFGQRVAYTAIF